MKNHYSAEELSRLSRKASERAQNSRFRATVHFMLPYVKFYKNLFKEYGIDWQSVKNVEDWRRKGLPLVQKAYFKKHPRDFVVDIPKEKAFDIYHDYLTAVEGPAAIGLWLKALASKKEIEKEVADFFLPKMPVFSGGTESGMPTPVMLTQAQKQTLRKLLKLSAGIISKQAGKKPITAMNLFPYGPHLAWHAAHEAMELAKGLNLSTAAGGAVPTVRLVQMAEAFKADVFAGMSNYVRNRFLQVAAEKKTKLPKEILFVNGAEKMHDTERKKIAEMAKKLGTKKTGIIDVFGASEFKEAILPECAAGQGFHHIAPLTTIIRTVTAEEGKEGIITDWNFTAPEKGGYGVIWNTDGAGTLLEGYLIGDKYDKVVHAKCPGCGLNVQRIQNINRIRNVEAQLKLTGMVEEKIKGTRIDLAGLRGRLLGIKGIQEAQVVSRKNKLILNLAGSKKKAQAELNKILEELEVTPSVNWKSLEKLTGDGRYLPIRVEK